MQTQTIYDFAAIGVGPFNLSLACLTAPIEGFNGIFLDKRESFNWHPGMLLQDTTLQIPFMADLVTLADPTSPYSFLNYIKKQGRIYSFYIRENFLLLRNEYNQYCQWVIKQLPNVHFGQQVDKITYDEAAGCYSITTMDVRTGNIRQVRARKLVLGTGTVPHVPVCCQDAMGKAIHSASYLHHKKRLQSKKSITVIGSGQSAAEIYYDLLQEIDVHGYALHWITRSPRFFPLEYSKLTLEMTSPEYVDYFFDLQPDTRDRLLKSQQHLYKGINKDLIGAIYDLLYIKRISSPIDVSLRTNSELKKVITTDADDGFTLDLHQTEQNKPYTHYTEGLVLATGYTYRLPDFLQGISDRIASDNKGRLDVQRNYTIDRNHTDIFVQNAELHTHGFVTPDLGMGCYRNSYIIKEMTGHEYYPIEKRIAFQQFHAPEEQAVLAIEQE